MFFKAACQLLSLNFYQVLLENFDIGINIKVEMVEFLEVGLVDFEVELIDKIWIFEVLEVIEDLFGQQKSEFLVDPGEE